MPGRVKKSTYTRSTLSARTKKQSLEGKINCGDCVKIPDGRIARVRDISKNDYRVRVRRKNSKNHQFLKFAKDELTKAQCPKGWMSPEGYNRYLRETLAKMKKRIK
ncbi:MAG: hypothetical protein WCC17_15805 [Candidatus Nitrosopolaris sp.]